MKMLRSIAVLAALLVSTGCDDDPTGPDVETVAGTYTATEFRIGTGSGSQDLLALGGSIDITLNVNGTTTGTLYVPAFGGDEELDASLTGTWSLDGRTVTFEQGADTFVRDMSFRYTEPGILTGDELFAGGLVEVVLTR